MPASAYVWHRAIEVEVNLGYHYQESSAESRYEDNPAFGTGEEYVIYKFATDPQDNELNLISADVEFDLGFARLTSATGYSSRGSVRRLGIIRVSAHQYPAVLLRLSAHYRAHHPQPVE